MVTVAIPVPAPEEELEGEEEPEEVLSPQAKNTAPATTKPATRKRAHILLFIFLSFRPEDAIRLHLLGLLQPERYQKLNDFLLQRNKIAERQLPQKCYNQIE